MRTEMGTRLDSTLAESLAEYRAVAGRLEAVMAEAASVTGSARSTDRCVHASVGPHGELTGLRIDAVLAQRLDTAALAARILEAARLATAQARDRMRSTLTANLPEHLRHVVDAQGRIDVRRLLPDPELIRARVGR